MSDMTAAVSGAQGRRIFVNRRTKTIIFAALIFLRDPGRISVGGPIE